MAINVRPSIITSGLVLNLDAANMKSYPRSGTVWNDLSGNNYSGSLTNGPTFNSQNGGSIVFDGVNDYVPTVASSSGSATSNYTFSTWVKPVVTGSYFLNRGNDGAGSGWSLLAGISIEGKYYIGVVTTIPSLVGYSLTSSFAASLNTWTNITGVWLAGSSLSLYVNGLPDNSIAIPGTVLRSSTLGWVLGRITTTIYSAGTISTSLVYNRTLSAQEILQNYNATKTRFGLQ